MKLIKKLFSKREVWEYGTVNGDKARRHKKEGSVQHIIWKKGDQQHVDGVGHIEDKWLNTHRSWWDMFIPDSETVKEDTEKQLPENKTVSSVSIRLMGLIIFYVVALSAVIIIKKQRSNSGERNRIKKKLRYFNPIITEGFWGKKITWVGRERPLTDEELEKFDDIY